MQIKIDPALTADEVVQLRKASGWDHDLSEWQASLKQNLINVSARDEQGKVVGVCFLCGNQRHAEMTDLVVHPDYRQKGIGRQLFRVVASWALEHKIKYLSLTYDKDYPWLKDLYESEGFQSIDFAMWHTSSLDSHNNN